MLHGSNLGPATAPATDHYRTIGFTARYDNGTKIAVGCQVGACSISNNDDSVCSDSSNDGVCIDSNDDDGVCSDRKQRW